MSYYSGFSTAAAACSNTQPAKMQDFLNAGRLLELVYDVS